MRVVNYPVGFDLPMLRLHWFPVSLAVVMLAFPLPASAPPRQAPGYAEITVPEPGSSVQGIVTVHGSANHPSFASYDLTFSYAEDATGTWFATGPSVTSPVVDGALGLWDTSQISPGRYVLRLRVLLSTGAVLEAQVRDLRLGLPPAASSAARATPTTALVPATATPPPLVDSPAEPSTPGNPVGAALVIGGVMAAGGLLLFGGYITLQHALAVWLGGLRMRRVLRGPRSSRPPPS
jgi:hypothetical protein